MGNFFLMPWKQTEKKTKPPPWDSFSLSAFKAASEGNVEKLHDLAGECSLCGPQLADLREPTTGESLLHEAMMCKDGECARFLIAEAGCKVDCPNHSGETPIHIACMEDNVDGLRVALELNKNDGVGALLKVKDMWKRTPLIKAMVYGSHNIVRMLLELDGNVLNISAQDSFGFSAAHLAARYRQLDILRMMAEKGANLNLQTEQEHTPLSLAITAGNPDMVRLLLEMGAKTAPSTASLRPHQLYRHAPASQPILLAIGELISHAASQQPDQGDSSPSQRAEQVLHLMLNAHGFVLHPYEPDVFLRVLYTSDMKRYLPLLCKMHLCSDSLYSNVFSKFSGPVESVGSELSGRLETTPCCPLSLFDLARRRARKSLMASGRNVTWAVDRLRQQSGGGVVLPPALLGPLLMKDCDPKEPPDRIPSVPWPTSASERLSTYSVET